MIQSPEVNITTVSSKLQSYIHALHTDDAMVLY